MSTLKTNWQKHEPVSKPRWNEIWTITYDKRAATFYKHKVSLSTVNGRVELGYQTPAELDGTPYEKYILDSNWEFTTSELSYTNSQYYLHASVKREFPPNNEVSDTLANSDNTISDNEDAIRVLGVDLNVNGNTAVTSTGGFYGNADLLNHKRQYFEELRGELQQTGTRSAHLTLVDKISPREAGWLKDYKHIVSNAIVRDAVESRSTHIIFEELEGIRDRMSNLPDYQQWMFKDIPKLVEYKAEEYGINVVFVDPRNTSKSCSMIGCDCCPSENRSGKEFECVECGLELDADYNAARNIGFVELDKISSGRTCQSEKANCQLALMSGTVSSKGVFTARNFAFTDKPTPSGVA